MSAADTAPAVRARRRGPDWSRIGWGVAGVLLLGLLWEGYKAIGPEDGLVIGGVRVLPRTSDLAMPHIWEIFIRISEGTTSSSRSEPLWLDVLLACAVTLGIAAVGWLVGLVIGMALALLMQRWKLAEAAVLPWVVLSQTVPLIAFAPLVKTWGSQIEIGDFEWADWMSVAVIASYLAFFPIAIGALRGLNSPDAIHNELFRSYAAGWSKTLIRLRLPAAVPYLLPALRLAAANAVVGAVVAEVSTGMQGGIGRMLVTFAGQASGDPEKAWAPIIGAVLLGLIAAGSVGILGMILKNYRRAEVNA
ncbi:ABC transporter permease [Naumannella halotolerans]|uniref:NitT/TauT family transport system permease protein n=1 Tax=Naumannella halotolerans TaxID=993414 RepID=A0A4R7IYC0_9ACTN|nr:ABC transporter permease subunit [Naumannella halotolerans]TDT29056.1 NitT/TauT family transport system permease protein [Naumannella halotolerans]